MPGARAKGIGPAAASLRVLLRTRWAPLSLALVLVGLTVWRWACIGLGPDPDGDAYGHHAIARQILAEPRNLGAHWVWLPLFHYLSAGAVALGATLDAVRYVNAALSAVTPALLFMFLSRREARRSGEGLGFEKTVPWLAAMVCAFCPIAMQMGTTGQTEPLFALLLLATILLLDRERFVAAGLVLGAATLVRYESWAALPAISCALVFTHVRHRRFAPLVAVLLPAFFIVAWAAARVWGGERWFSFLRETRAFANDATHAQSSLDGGLLQLLRDLVYYAVDVPWRVFQWPLLLAPFGLVRTLRRQGPWFAMVYASILGFITLTWVSRSQLGLDRHLLSLVPFYATLIANGLATLATLLLRLVSRVAPASIAQRAAAFGARAAFALGAATLVVLSWTLLDRWMVDWTNAVQGAFADRRAAGGFLRTLPDTAIIVCDESTVEILSGLDRKRFDRSWVDAPTTPDHVVLLTNSAERPVYIASWLSKMGKVRPLGEMVYSSNGKPEGDTGLGILHVRRDQGGGGR